MSSITISVITVSFNNLVGLKKTIHNVFEQSSLDFEHIIIDGGSNDGTAEYLKSLDHSNVKYISEPDKGIYDAMNKGITLANGEWVIFMNAGDVFSCNQVIQFFLDQNFPKQIVYGNCSIQYDNGFIRESKPNDLKTMWKGMTFSHQAVFIKGELLKENEFDLNYKFCADFNQLFTLYRNKEKFQYWNYIIAQIEAGGVSDAKRYLSTNEVYKINKLISPKIKNHIYFIPKIFWGFVVVKIKDILPKQMLKRLIQFKYSR